MFLGSETLTSQISATGDEDHYLVRTMLEHESESHCMDSIRDAGTEGGGAAPIWLASHVSRGSRTKP